MNPHDETQSGSTPEPEVDTQAETEPRTEAPGTDDDTTSSTGDDSGPEGRRSVTDELKATARKVWLAGLGALSVAEAEGTRVFNKLVENGEEFEKRNRPKVDEMKAKAERVRVKANAKIDALEKRVGSAVSSKLQGAGIAAQEQVDELRERIAELEAALSKMTDSDTDTDADAHADAAVERGGPDSSDEAGGADVPPTGAAPGAGETSDFDDASASNDPESDRPM